MDDDELTAVLQDAGLSPYQAAAYVALLELGSATATDVANACEVPDPRIYDVLRDLDEMGYVETYQQDCLTARAHDPETVLTDLRERSNEYLTAADEIEKRWSQPAVDDHEVSIVTRFETVLNRSREWIEGAGDEVVLATPVDHLDALRDDLAAALDRGVHVKLCLYADDPDEELPPTETLADICTEARHRDFPGPYLMVADRRWTCFSADREGINEYGILVEDQTHTSVFHWFFRSVLWETWNTIYAESRDELPREYVELVTCLRDVVPLMEDGYTVEMTVEGTDTTTRERVEVSGHLIDSHYTGDELSDEGVFRLEPLAGLNYFRIETPSGETYSIGGWSARLEDLEARRITVTDLIEP